MYPHGGQIWAFEPPVKRTEELRFDGFGGGDFGVQGAACMPAL